jgi:hypothetical protein
MHGIFLSSALVVPLMFGAAANAVPVFYPATGSPNLVVTVKKQVKWKSDGCKYRYKASAKGFQEKYKCK